MSSERVTGTLCDICGREAQQVDVYNSGLVVFLYDETNRDAIIAAKPGLIRQGFGGEEELKDKKLKKLAEEGLLAAYELQQDDELRIAVTVGAPLSSKEAKSRHWMKPQTARLALPSGKLCIEGYDSLRLWDEGITDPGATIEVPPGDYGLTLYRTDYPALEEAGVENFEGPQELIVLTPWEQTKQKKPAAMMVWPTPRPVWGKYTIADGVFNGKASGGAFIVEGVISNLDPAAAAQLGLQRGMRLQFEIDGQSYQALYLAGLCSFKPMMGVTLPNDYRRFFPQDDIDAIKAREPELLVANWAYDKEKDIRVLGFYEFKGKAPRSSKIKPGMPLSVRCLPDAVMSPPDLSWVDAWNVNNGVLFAEVLGSGAMNLVLNVDATALQTLGAEPGREMRLKSAGQGVALLYLEDLSAWERETNRPPAENMPRIEEARRHGNEIAAQRREQQQLLDDRETYPYDSPQRKAVEFEIAERLKEMSDLHDEIRKLSQPLPGAPLRLGGYLAPHWDLLDKHVLFCVPITKGREITSVFNVKVGDKVELRST